MPHLVVITHPEVTIDPDIPVPDWGLSNVGRKRATRFATSPVLASVTHIWTSAETKACQTADILAAPRALPISIDARLGENDRSATGFLLPARFEAAADAFFARPESSYQGWERAVDAKARIVSAVHDIAQQHRGGSLALVTHGAVGTLLLCHLNGTTIDRAFDQPGQGHYWIADLTSLQPARGWTSIG